MKKYEYKKANAITVCSDSQCRIISEARLNEWGELGWELVTFTFWNGRVAFAYFKREKKK